MNVQDQGSTQDVGSTQQTSAADQAGNVKSGPSGTAPKTYKNLDELFKAEPEFQQVVLMGMAQKVCNDMKESQDRLKQIRLESQQQS